jgi:aminoglycoside/choline kinase family phosphotransferase
MDQRLSQLSTGINQQLLQSHRYQGPSLSLDVVSGDASFRRYFRCRYQSTSGESESVICVDAPPDKENNPAFVNVLQGFKATGVMVPDLLALDYDQGFMMLSDLGDCLLMSVLNETTVEGYFEQGRDELLRIMQAEFRLSPLPVYDEALMLREMELFRDWFCGRYLQLELSDTEHQLLSETFSCLFQQTRLQETVPVHRDYHTRNLMVLDDGSLGVIDFQDAVMGPVTYDLLSLLRDETCITWPEASVKTWTELFAGQLRQRGLTRLDNDDFWYGFNVMGAQRHLKVAGIFARLCYRDNKPNYLAHTPKTVRYLLQELEVVAAQGQPAEVAPVIRFRAWLKQRVITALAKQQPQSRELLESLK